MVYTNINPMQDVRRYLQPSQVIKILESASDSKGWRRDRDVLLIGLLAYTGRRVGEILRIKMEDILWDEQQIYFNILKKKHKTKVLKPINSTIWKLLSKYIADNKWYEGDYVFKSSWDTDKPISGARVIQIVYHYCDRAGIPNFEPGKRVHPHTFRHSFAVAASKKLKNPGDLRKLQKALEHSKIDITTFYLQFHDEEQREIMEEVYS